MGLHAEAKTRRKISSDPNNTKWSRDTTTFGQRILRSQGWQPGQYLGSQDAPHAELHTAANASFVRVALKDDMKGLGFDRAKDDEVTGLGVFSDLLSRLNGKSEEAVEDEQRKRLVVKTSRYVESRFGAMRFVSGGLLVGDEMKGVEDDGEKEEMTSKKRKAEPSDEEDDKAARKRARKEEKRRRKEEEKDAEKEERRARKKEKKEKRKESAEATEDDTPEPTKQKSKSKDSDDEALTKAERKARKKEKKEKKRRKAESEASSESTPASSAVPTGTSTPVDSGTSTPGSRNHVRARFIAQKRQAVMDAKALNQIFMVKT